MTRAYRAAFLIDCGVSPDLEIIYPTKVERIEIIPAESPQIAYQNVMSLAVRFAESYLSNPDTGWTIVQLLSLRDDNLLIGGDVSFDASKSVVKRSVLEHLAARFSESR